MINNYTHLSKNFKKMVDDALVQINSDVQPNAPVELNYQCLPDSLLLSSIGNRSTLISYTLTCQLVEGIYIFSGLY